MNRGYGRLRAGRSGASGGAPATGLTRFFTGGVSGKNVVVWGDSTIGQATTMWDVWNTQVKAPGGELAGANIINLGVNGMTMAAADTSAVITANPDLLILRFGLNDVRAGGVDAATLQTRITSKIATIRASKPNCDIVLWTPNSMLSTDPGSTGWVTPSAASAQAYTDIMWNAYNNLRGVVTNSISVDNMTGVFGRTCPATSPLMDDILHPGGDGQKASMSYLLPFITPPATPINLTASAAAWTSNPNNPETVYARAWEDTRYAVMEKEVCISTYVDLAPNVMIYVTQKLANGPAVVEADFGVGKHLWTPNGTYHFTGVEGYGSAGAGVVQIYSIPKANFPLPPFWNGKLYRKL